MYHPYIDSIWWLNKLESTMTVPFMRINLGICKILLWLLRNTWPFFKYFLLTNDMFDPAFSRGFWLYISPWFLPMGNLPGLPGLRSFRVPKRFALLATQIDTVTTWEATVTLGNATTVGRNWEFFQMVGINWPRDWVGLFFFQGWRWGVWGDWGGLFYFVPLLVCVFVRLFWGLRWMNHIAFLKTGGWLELKQSLEMSSESAIFSFFF